MKLQQDSISYDAKTSHLNSLAGRKTLENQPILNLQLLTEIGAFENRDIIEDISGQASGEAALEKMLKKVNLLVC